MKSDYECLRCSHPFVIEITEMEFRSYLDPLRKDACPRCQQRVGAGPVTCRNCRASFTLDLPHWHVQCNLAAGDCPACKTRYVTPCIC